MARLQASSFAIVTIYQVIFIYLPVYLCYFMQTKLYLKLYCFIAGKLPDEL